MRTQRVLLNLLALTAFGIQSTSAQELAYLLGDEASNHSDFGRAVGDAGDVDQDGVPDVIVGAPFYDGGGGIGGGVFVYSGRTGELLWSRMSEFDGDAFGWSVDGLGDIDGDGASDVIVGAPLYDANGTIPSGSGKFYVFSPATDGTIKELTSSVLNAQYGSVVKGVGDINGDGIGDFLTGSHQSDQNGFTDNGMVIAWSGATTWALWTRVGTESGSWYGYSIDVIRATGNPSTSRLIIGAPRFDGAGVDRGETRILNGSGTTIRVLSGSTNNSWSGYAVSGLGDVNHDGLFDYAVSTPYADVLGAGTDAGFVKVYSGDSTSMLFSVNGPSAGARLGQSLSGFGDLNADGTPDLLIGSPNLNANGVSASGEVRVVSGSNGATLASYAGGLNDSLGRDVSAAGDLNFDGYGDFLFGAPDAPWGAGQAQVHLSNTSAPSTYCTAKVNSQGCTPSVSHAGLASTSISNSFHVSAEDVINQSIGLLLWGRSAASTPFMGGTLCVGAPHKRTTPQSSAGNTGGPDCSGSYDFHFSHAYMASQAILPGDSIYAQYWSRDAQASFTVGLTDAVGFTVVP